MEFLVSVLQNAAVLSFVGLGLLTIDRYFGLRRKVAQDVAVGIVLGLTTFLVTFTPIHMPDGATVDARAGPMLLSAFLGGPVGALIAAAIGASGRAFVGGSFALSGVIVFFLYAFFGWLLLRSKLLQPSTLLSLKSVLLLCATSFAGATSMFFLIQPRERAIAWLFGDIPNIYVANAFSVILMVLIIDLALGIIDNFKKTESTNRTLRLAQRAGQFGVWDYNIKNDDLTWDDLSAKIHGISPDEKPNDFQTWSKLVNPIDLEIVSLRFSDSIKTGIEFDSEYRTSIPGAPEKIILGNAIILKDREGNAERVVGTNFDLTAIRRAENELREIQSIAARSQKFDTIGKLSGGVAHDFNNLLAIIMGNQELLLDEMKTVHGVNAETFNYIETTIQAVRRGSELTASMLAYARQARLEPSETDVNLIVRETERWMVRTIESRIEVETVLQAGIWPIQVDQSSLQSALVNLIMNAKDAMSAGGKLTIETANVRIDDSYLSQTREDIQPGRYVMLAVSDTGEGISQDKIEKIFEPFFTTKTVGQGTGLGLSMVEGFARQSGGAVRVYSEEGVGTCFKLYFAAADYESSEDKSARIEIPDKAAPVSTRVRVLVVEDNIDVLAVIKKTLENAGYAVVTATTGDQAFKIFEKDQDFDIALTDIVMPGTLQGPAVAKACRSIKPDLPFVFFSGYASEAAVHGNGLHPDDIRLMKPVSRTDLLGAISKLLEKAAQK